MASSPAPLETTPVPKTTATPKRVLFITTPWQSSKENSIYSGQISFPLGIAYLAAIARKQGHEVKVVDSLLLGWKNTREEENRFIRGLTWDQIREEIKGFNPDVVAISGSFSSQADMVHKIASIVKEQNPEAVTLLGGAYASAEGEKAAEDRNIDFVFKGEAEKTFERFLGSEDPSTIPGLIFHRDGKTIFTGPAERYGDMNEIPFPAYDLMHLEKYFQANLDGAVIRGKVVDRTVSMITSRGCPHLCNFCSIYQTWGRQWRFRSPENVVDEIELLVKKYGVQHILFEDDNMTISMDRFEKICDMIVERQLTFTWETPNGIRGDRVTFELAKKMKAAGCKRVRIAIENGDQETLDKVIKKSLNLNRAEEGVKACLRAGLNVDCFFIFGIPGETKETLEKTHDLALKFLKLGAIPLCSIAVPLPDTDLYNESKEKGFLIKELDWSDVMSARIKPILRTDKFGPEDVMYWYNKTQRDIWMTILTHPWLFLRTNAGSDIFKSPAKLVDGIRKIYNGSLKPFLMSGRAKAEQA